MSPYIFNIVIDFLTRWISLMERVNLLQAPFQNYIMCLLYADDALVFLQPHEQQFRLFKVIMQLFHQLSELKVNIQKSTISSKICNSSHNGSTTGSTKISCNTPVHNSNLLHHLFRITTLKQKATRMRLLTVDSTRGKKIIGLEGRNAITRREINVAQFCFNNASNLLHVCINTTKVDNY
jgi:Reverse transcriptase (RNA-dependent DNA polymerase)